MVSSALSLKKLPGLCCLSLNIQPSGFMETEWGRGFSRAASEKSIQSYLEYAGGAVLHGVNANANRTVNGEWDRELDLNFAGRLPALACAARQCLFWPARPGNACSWTGRCKCKPQPSALPVSGQFMHMLSFYSASASFSDGSRANCSKCSVLAANRCRRRSSV